jgi:catechol 2,3-dioxygenase-like lactoylglutathione lyase family enzyme
MYLPAAFAESDLTRLHDFIEQNSFGLLVSQVDGLPFASHLPFLLERPAGPHGTLVGHMARANPQWREASGQTALAIFSGPHAYISPTWYEAEPHGATGSGHFAMGIEAEAFDSWRKLLQGHGATIEKEVEWPRGGKSLYFRDPAGNSVELVTPGVWGLPSGW